MINNNGDNMKGKTLRYCPNTDNNRTLLNHTLFGRLVYRNYRGRKYANYVPGMLHNIPFARLTVSKIFIPEAYFDKLDLDLLNIFADLLVETVDLDELEIKTGEEHWISISTEKGVPIRKSRRYKK